MAVVHRVNEMLQICLKCVLVLVVSKRYIILDLLKTPKEVY